MNRIVPELKRRNDFRAGRRAAREARCAKLPDAWWRPGALEAE